MVIRLFLSAIAPSDLAETIRVFKEDVIPAFEAHPDCLGIELVMCETPGVGGLIEGGALSRWTSEKAMTAAVTSPELLQAQVRVRELLRREPIRKWFNVVA